MSKKDKAKKPRVVNIPDDERLKNQLIVLLPDPLDAALSAAARRMAMRPSQVVRQILAGALIKPSELA